MLSEQFSLQASLNSQESILYSALYYIVLCWVLFEQFSPQASLNSQESILYSALNCIVLCWVVLCRVVLYYIVLYSPTVSKNRKIRAKVDSRIYGRWRLWVMGSCRSKLTSLPTCGFIAQLIKHRTGIAEVTGSNPVEALIFSGFSYPIA